MALAGSALTVPGFLRNLFGRDDADGPAGELGEVVDDFLNKFPQERSLAALSEKLGLDLMNSTVLQHPEIVASIQQDFTEGRTISVRGWILSITEVRALAFLRLSGQ